MTPTPTLRWNEACTAFYKRQPRRLEQLWVGPNDKKEWRPISLVKLGWDSNNYNKPLPDEETL